MEANAAVITDIQMSEMDGIELIPSIRSNAAYHNIVIIANTQYVESEQEVELLELGANDFIYKPANPVILKARLSNAIFGHRNSVLAQKRNGITDN